MLAIVRTLLALAILLAALTSFLTPPGAPRAGATIVLPSGWTLMEDRPLDSFGYDPAHPKQLDLEKELQTLRMCEAVRKFHWTSRVGLEQTWPQEFRDWIARECPGFFPASSPHI